MSQAIRRLALVGLTAGLAALAAAGFAEPPIETTVVKDGMGQVTFLRFSPSGHELVRICQFGGVQLLDTKGYEKMRTFSIGMRAVAYSPDGKLLATAEGTDGARVWDATRPGKPRPPKLDAAIPDVSVLRTPLRVLQGPGRARRVFRAEFSADGKRLLTTHADGHVKVWGTTDWKVEHDLALTTAEVRAAAFAPDGKTIVIGDVEGALHEWSFEKKVAIWTGQVKGAVMGIAFAPEGGAFVTVQLSRAGGSVVFWDAARKAVETRPGFKSVAFSRDGKLLALGGARVELLDPVTRKASRVIELAELSMGEANSAFGAMAGSDKKIPVSVTALAFSPDGVTLAAGCAEGTVRVVKLKP